MRLEYIKDHFVLYDVSFIDKNLPKISGFSYSPKSKAWVTPFSLVAKRVSKYASSKVRERRVDC